MLACRDVRAAGERRRASARDVCLHVSAHRPSPLTHQPVKSIPPRRARVDFATWIIARPQFIKKCSLRSVPAKTRHNKAAGKSKAKSKQHLRPSGILHRLHIKAASKPKLLQRKKERKKQVQGTGSSIFRHFLARLWATFCSYVHPPCADLCEEPPPPKKKKKMKPGVKRKMSGGGKSDETGGKRTEGARRGPAIRGDSIVGGYSGNRIKLISHITTAGDDES